MKKILITSGILLHSIVGMALPRSIQQAQIIAESFVGSAISFHEGVSLQKRRFVQKSAEVCSDAYYVFNIEDTTNHSEPNGFVIVSADDEFVDILGYSTCGSFEEGNLPEGLVAWLETLEKEMEAAKSISSSSNTNKPNSISYKAEGQPSIKPLIKTTWAQGVPYNNDIPVESTNYANSKGAAGCVATAMAQIMNYWRWPDGYANGRHTNENCKGAYVYYGFARYDWDILSDHYGLYYDEESSGKQCSQEYSEEAAAEVAKLMYHCGVATDTKWGNESSAGNVCALKALMTYYKYNKYLHAEARDVYSDREFRDILLNELNHGRPMLYWAKNKSNAGHYFICDGFDTETGMFHFNWGWSGHYNGYYALSALCPQDSDGQKSSMGTFSYDHFICVGCQPDNEGEYTPVFTANAIRLTSEPQYGYAANISLSNFTNSSVNFNGDIGIALLQDGEIKYSKFDKTFDQLGSNEYFKSVTVSSMKLNADIADGEYIFCVVAMTPSGTYSIIKANYGTTYMWKLSINAKDRSVIFTPIEIKDDVPDIITQTTSENKEIVRTEFYTLSGIKVENPIHGIYIRKTTYADGTKKALKIAL